MSDQRPHNMPSPRDHDDPTLSEIVPFRSTKINLKRSPAFYFLIIIAVAVPFLLPAFLNIMGSKNAAEATSAIRTTGLAITFVICAMLQTMVYMSARTNRSFLHYWYAFVVVAALLMSPLMAPFFYVFRNLWPFYQQEPKTFIAAFLSHFSGAGLMEELIKAIPTLIGAWIGYKMVRDPALTQNKGAQFVAVRGPLDGAIMGVFAGGGFTLIETGIQYLFKVQNMVAEMTRSAEAGLAAAFLVLIPRALGAAVGHMAYAGIFGYFIGLAVLRPKHAVKLLAIGWVAASTIHALWNSVAMISPYLQYVVAGIAAVGLASVLLKARQLEQARTGVAAETFGSIVVERPAAPAAAGYVPAGVSPTPYQPAGAPPVAPAQPAAAPYQPAVAATAHSVAEQALVLEVDGLKIPLRADSTLDLAAEPALGGKGAGVTGAVVPHPTRANVLGLRNTGANAWTARLRDGSQQEIARDQNIRLAPGVTIAFGDGLIGSVVAAS